MTFIEDLLDIQVPSTIKISPNCQQILYSTILSLGHRKGEHEASTLWLADTGHTKSSRQLTSGLYNDQDPRWSPDGNSVAFISDRAKQGEQWAIYMLPTKVGGEAYPLTPVENERGIATFEFSPDGKFIAYISADEKSAEKKAKEKDKDDAQVWEKDWPYRRLRLLHVGTKKISTLVSYDAQVVGLEWNEDGTKIAFAETPTPDMESQYSNGVKISIVDVPSRQIKEICTFPNEMPEFIWAGDAIYFLGPVAVTNEVSAHRVWSVDLNADKPTYEPCAYGKDECAWGLNKAGQDVVVQVQDGMEDQIRMLNRKTVFSRKQEIAAWGSAWDAAFTTDSDEMIIAVALGDSSTPPEVFTTTASGGAMVQLSNHGQLMSDRPKLCTTHFLRCRSADDKVDLDAIYITPSDTKDKPKRPLPTIVSIHGGPYNRITDTFNPSYYMWTNVLVNAGYGILCPNYRGSSGRGEEFAASVRGACGTVDHEDIITLTNHAVEEGYADKERLVVSGWSQGGFLSFMSSVRNGMHPHDWRFKAAIPGAGVSDGDTMSLTSDIGAFQGDLAENPPWKCNKEDTAGRTGSSLWEFKKAVEKGALPPMLMLHGEEDKRVPLEQSIGFRRALESVHAPFEMVVYPREPHLFAERKHIVDMAERVLRFVDMHIGGKELSIR